MKSINKLFIGPNNVYKIVVTEKSQKIFIREPDESKKQKREVFSCYIDGKKNPIEFARLLLFIGSLK